MVILNKSIKAALFGCLLGATFVAFWFGVNHCDRCSNFMMLRLWPDYVKLITWPSSILLIGDPTNFNYGLQTISAIINVVYFSMLGFLIERALHKSKIYLVFLVSLLIMVYYNSFKLYL